MKLKKFKSFLNEQRENDPSNPKEAVVFGGFSPGQTNVGTYLSDQKIGLFEDVQDDDDDDFQEPKRVSKAPILFDQHDVDFLAQFPPMYWSQALAWRYGDGLRHMSELQQAIASGDKAAVQRIEKEVHLGNSEESLDEVPDWAYVPIKPRGKYGRGKEAQGTYFKVRSDFTHLLDKLQRPVKADKLASIHKDPDRKWDDPHAEYVGDEGEELGLHGFNLKNWESVETNVMNRKGVKEKQQVAEGFMGLTESHAKNILNDWRLASKDGWLGRFRDVPFGLISIGAGRRDQRQNDGIDWSGKTWQISPDETGVMLPHVPEDLLREQARQYEEHSIANITANGDVQWRFFVADKDGNLQENTTNYSKVPFLPSGRYIENGAVKRYYEGWTQGGEDEQVEKVESYASRLEALARRVNEGDKSAAQELQELYLETKTVQKEAEKWDQVDWMIHHFSYLQDQETGKRLYPPLYTHNSVVRGGFHPHGQQKEKFGGKKSTWKILENMITGAYDPEHKAAFHRGDTSGTHTFITPWGRKKVAAVASGVGNYLKDQKEADDHWSKLVMMEDAIVQEATLFIRGIIGRPEYDKLAAMIKEHPNDPDWWEEPSEEHPNGPRNFYNLVYKMTRNKAFLFTQEIGQMDLGAGTRRMREKGRRGAVSLQQTTGSGSELGNIAQGQRPSAAAGADLARGRGERHFIRGTEAGSLIRAHSIEEVRKRIEEHVGEMKRLQQVRNARISKIDQGAPSSDELKQSMGQSIQNMHELQQDYVNLFILQHMQSNPDEPIDMEAALAAANRQIQQEFGDELNIKDMSDAELERIQQHRIKQRDKQISSASVDHERLKQLQQIVASTVEGTEESGVHMTPQVKQYLTQAFNPQFADAIVTNPQTISALEQLIDTDIQPGEDSHSATAAGETKQALKTLIEELRVALGMRRPRMATGTAPKQFTPQAYTRMVAELKRKMLRNSPGDQRSLAALQNNPNMTDMVRKAIQQAQQEIEQQQQTPGQQQAGA